MKINYAFLFFLSAMVFASSCSKEKQIATNLTSQAGRWNIDNYKVTEIITTPSITFPPTITDLSDLGYMNFFDNNDGQIFFIYDVGDYDFIEFEWTPTEQGIFLEYSNEEFEYVFTTNEKDRIVMVNTIVVPLDDTTTKTTEKEYELLRIE
ncbi:MAG: hypothetical protein ACKVPJ_12730 [Chitinophagales bacterium]